MASPNIKFFNRDEGSFTVTSADTVVALVGFAKKGPIGEPVFCNTKKVFQDIFGKTPKEFPYSHLAAYNYFTAGSNLWFVRIADINAAPAEGRVLTNNGDGVVAKITSAKAVGSGADDTNFLSTATYGITIEVEKEGVSYIDTISSEFVDQDNVDLTKPIAEVINNLNIAISNSAILAGKCIFTRVNSLGNPYVLATDKYVALQTTAGGMDDAIYVSDPDAITYTSLISSLGFQLSAFGNYSAPGKAVITGTIMLDNPVDLVTVPAYNINLAVDGDLAVTTVDIAAEDIAGVTTDLTGSPIPTTITTSPTAYAIEVVIDGTTATIDVTGDLGVTTSVKRSVVASRINAAITSINGTCKLVNSQFVIKTKTAGRSGSVALNDTTNGILALMTGTGALLSVGGDSVTIDEMTVAINKQLNTSRGTSGIDYASKTPDNKIEFTSIKSSAAEGKMYINTLNGTSATAPGTANAIGVFFTAPATYYAATGTDGTVNGMFKFIFKEKGTAPNKTTSTGCYVSFTSRLNDFFGTTSTAKYLRDMHVFYDGLEVEPTKFRDISFDASAKNWVMNVVNAEIANGGSQYVYMEWYQADKDGVLDEDLSWSPAPPTSGVYLVPNTTVDLTGGNDGIATTGLESLYIGGLNKYDNPELYSPHLIALPAISSISVINSVINFINTPLRNDILYLVDSPFGLKPQEVANWHNGKSGMAGAPTSAINTEYGALYYSWAAIYDDDNSERVWCPPSVFMVGKLTNFDNNYGPWSIPAGDRRGDVSSYISELEYSPSQPERDLLYDITGNLNVNPIVNFPGQGATVYGQKTLYRVDSPRTRLNVERLLIYTKKLVRRVLKKYIFEPNVQATWTSVTGEINNIYEPIKQQGGLTAYQVIFDSTTTTTSLQNQFKMAGIIRLKVPFAIEAIEVLFSTVGNDVNLG